jgi:hypothetical protein
MTITKRAGRSPKLTSEQIQICVTELNNGISPRVLGDRFGVHPTTIRSACRDLLSDVDDTSLGEEVELTTIPGFSDYFVDSNGDIYSKRQGYHIKKMTPTLCGRQFKVAVIADNTHVSRQYPIKELVCMTFHGDKPSPNHSARHIDGDYTNNKPDNIEWSVDGDIVRTIHAAKGEAHGRAKLTKDDVLEILAYNAAKESISDIARIKRIHPTTVTSIISRRLWSHLDISKLPTVRPIIY